MPAPFRLAIVGCGKIAASHSEAALTSGRAEIVALVDPVPARAAALAERFRISPRIASDIADVQHLVEGAIIATPNDTHADLAERCLAAQLSVLIEKPLAIGLDEAQRICDAARRSGGTVAVGYVSRFREPVRLMARLIREGYFGRIHRFAYQFGTKGGWAPLSGYTLNRRTSGGGVLVTTGTHFLDRMISWFGYPNEAWLEDDSRGGPEANATAYVVYQGSQSFTGMCRFSKTVKMPSGFVMETERGMVILPDVHDARIILRPTGTSDLETSIYRANAMRTPRGEFVQQLDDFILAVRTGREPAVTAEQGLRSVQLLEYLYRHRRPSSGKTDPEAIVVPS